MRNPLLCAIGAALALAVSAPAVAQQHTQHDSMSDHRDDNRRDDNRRAPAIHKDSYGSWNSSWGARPGAAPKFWTKKGDWYRHVRACQRKYRSYNSRTDTYRVSARKIVRCRL